MDLLDIDEIQARAILDMQLRKLAALERQQLVDEYEELMTQIAEYEAILASPERQREIVSTELAEIVDKYGDDRRTEIIAYDGDMSVEDLIAEEDVVVTITRGGYAKRTKTDLYRAQRRGAARASVVRSCARTTSSTTSSSPRRTTGSCSSRTRAGCTGPRRTSCPMPAATLAASTWRTCWPSSRTSESPRCWRCATTRSRRTWCWPRRAGLVKKSRLTDFDSPRTGGIIAINLREDDEVIAARLVSRRAGPAAGQQARPGDQVPGHRRGTPADGPGHLRRDRDAIHRGRPAARDARRQRGRGRAGRHQRRLRQTDDRRPVQRFRAAAASAWSRPGSPRTGAS